MSKLKLSSIGRKHKGNGNSEVKNNVTAEDCYKQISEAAYFNAEKRGFAPGCELDDWLHAETEVLNHLQETLQ